MATTYLFIQFIINNQQEIISYEAKINPLTPGHTDLNTPKAESFSVLEIVSKCCFSLFFLIRLTR